MAIADCLRCGKRKGRETCFGWALPPWEDGVWKGIRMGHGYNAGAKRTLEKRSYDYQSFHAVHNIIYMLTFATLFAIVNGALIV